VTVLSTDGCKERTVNITGFRTNWIIIGFTCALFYIIKKCEYFKVIKTTLLEVEN
jgi:hypothetical protein